MREERLKICRSNICGFYDPKGESEAAYVKGVESCGSCGCVLKAKTSCLDCECPVGMWQAVTRSGGPK